ncbi:MAG: ankyrin repeat domain-containing protein [Novosphingobium sp.]
MSKLLRPMLAGLCALAATVALAGPAAAQSTGYKFLEAVRKKDGATVEQMLGNMGAKGIPGGVIINTRDIGTGDTALHVVILQHNLEWLSYLIYRGADLNTRNNKGTTPLWLAVNSAFTEAAELLITKGARVNDPGPSGETPLIAAVHQKNLILVKALIKAGAEVGRADNSGRTALDYAALEQNVGAIGTELENAAKTAKARKAQSYGPTF